MIKNVFKKIFNLHLLLLLIVLCAGLLICNSCLNALESGYKQSCVEQKEQEINIYFSRMVNQFGITDYLKSTNTTIDNELNVASEFFGGRILVFNSAMQIIFDSYQRDTGKTAVMKDVISAFNGQNSNYCSWEDGIGVYSYGIVSESTGKVSGSILLTYSIDKEILVLERMKETGLIISTVVMILILFVTFIITQHIVNPLKKMKGSLAKISSGDLNSSLPEKGVSEFRDISSSVNNMLVKVRAINENQQEFVSNVSHELKTPMTSIKVLADSLLMQEGADVEMYREFLTDINEEIDRENKIITDLLQLVKLDKRVNDLNVSRYNMNEILAIVLRRVKPLAESKNIEVFYESYRDIIAEVDDSKMIMALTNLCENAIKYNKELGEVRVSLNADTQYFYVTIQDTGVGIPKESLEHVFERFYRVDKARDRATGGTGLGLAITNEIVRMHNGLIKVHSAEGMGTTFSMRIPLKYRKSENLM